MSTPKGFEDKVALVWAVADLLRGDFKPHEYGSVILPFVVLRRLECALEGSKDQVIEQDKKLGEKIKDKESILCKVSGRTFYNTSPYNLSKILADSNKVAANLNSYIKSFSPSAAEVLDKYGFPEKIKRLDEAGLLYKVVAKFADLDLTEKAVTNEAMGYVFEELLRKFSEMSNETAGEHYTPREVIRLMVNLLFIEDKESLSGQKPIRSIYDPACGTGGMLSIAEEHLKDMNPNVVLNVFGQELNDETWAIARSDLMIKGQDPKRIARGNSLTDEDGHTGTQFDYCISNPPYGVDWKKYEDKIRDEHEKLGWTGRYGAGLPRVSDGSFLFIQHMISKMKPYDPITQEGGSRVAIVLSASTIISGQAGSGESDIRKWIIENDLLEGIIALPDQMFYNTEIGTYIWILTNRKPKKAKGRVRLVDAREFWTKIPRSLGDKKKTITDKQIDDITTLYSEALSTSPNENVKVVKNDQLGYARLTIEQPLRCVWRLDDNDMFKLMSIDDSVIDALRGKEFRSDSELKTFLTSLSLNKKEINSLAKHLMKSDDSGEIQKDSKGNVKPDTSLRFLDIIDLPEDYIESNEDDQQAMLHDLAAKHLDRVIAPYLPNAWIDLSNIRVGYEIPFTRDFYKYKSPRFWKDIKDEITRLETEISKMETSLEHSLSIDPLDGLEFTNTDIGSYAVNKNWKCDPLFSLGHLVSDTGYPSLEPLSVYLNLGVIPRSSREDNKNVLGSDLSKYQRVIPGDLVFNKLRTWQGGFGIARQEGIVSPAYYIFRFTKEYILPDYVDFLLKTHVYLSAITRVTKWMPPSQYDTPWENIKSLPILYPHIDKQKEIVSNADSIKELQTMIEKLNELRSKYDEYRKSLSHFYLAELMAPKEGR